MWLSGLAVWSGCLGGGLPKRGAMSRKWQRVQRWDDEHLRGPVLGVVKVVLRTLSSIWLAVVLLVGVGLYGVLASVPVGLVALAPTWAVYAASAVAAVLLAAAAGATPVRMVIPPRAGALRFAATVLSVLAFGAVGAVLWHRLAWPALRYDAASGEGLRFFAGFVEAHGATTLRRLPAFEMTELEFYSWWPMRLLLSLFVVNLVVATVRRIEFDFKRIGVLTVHTGIVVMALGSLYYQRLKVEGDTILFAATEGAVAAAGAAGGDAAAEGAKATVPGRAQRGFYDGTQVALWVSSGGTWEQRPLRGVPRYNDRGLDGAEAGGRRTLEDVLSGAEEGTAGTRGGDEGGLEKGAAQDGAGSESRPTQGRGGSALGAGRGLRLEVPAGSGFVDPDLRFRVVGYAVDATLHETVVRGETTPAGAAANPLRTVELLSRLPDEATGQPDPDWERKPALRLTFEPLRPASRVRETAVMAFEYAVDMPAERWRDLQEAVPGRAGHALVVEVPGVEGAAATRVVVPAAVGGVHAIGATGWTVSVEQLSPEPPFPIITEGYRGASSSVAVVRVRPPGGGAAFSRWVYHRYPELNQDIADPTGPGERPVRSDPSAAIRIAYLDATRLQVYFDESSATGRVRALVRQPDGSVSAYGGAEGLEPGGALRDVVPLIDLRLGERWAHAERATEPLPTPEAERNPADAGTHARALLGVEISSGGGGGGSGDGAAWRTVVWLPFVKYIEAAGETSREVTLPDGRRLRMAFGRRWRTFPNFTLQMHDFEMISYDHRGAPRDYQSVVGVSPALALQRDGSGAPPAFEPYVHTVKLNAPLRAPVVWDASRSWIENAWRMAARGLDPEQFKLSQAGWDREGWTQSQEAADRGLTERPRARFTILQVGNNPGIHIIALGGVLMAVGTPWAFYVKPWLVKRERARLAKAAGLRTEAL